MRSSGARYVVALVASTMFALGLGASQARPGRSDTVTITLIANTNQQPALQVLIPNFERVYPNITVEPTYVPTTNLAEVEATELAAGNAPDIFITNPGSGSTIGVSELAKAGDLAAMIDKPWTRRSLPVVTSLDKVGAGLFAFTPVVAPEGIFTNDPLFAKLGLNVPQTFAQLLDVCQKAKAHGTTAVLLSGGSGVSVGFLVKSLAVSTLYAKDKQWATELKAEKVTFEGSAGWHQALQEFVDMSDAGCFQPGSAATTSATALFAQGQGLMTITSVALKGSIDAAGPQFGYSFHPLPFGTSPSQAQTLLMIGLSLSVNAHSSAANQTAAQTFIDFVARPKQDALYAQIGGGLTQYQFLKHQIPVFMPTFALVLANGETVVDPQLAWWNPSVTLALQQDAIGLVTGQSSIDDVLNAMDAGWKQGPS